MTCEEFRQQVDAWALGALEPDEVAALEAHLRASGEHHGCVEALQAGERDSRRTRRQASGGTTGRLRLEMGWESDHRSTRRLRGLRVAAGDSRVGDGRRGGNRGGMAGPCLP